MTTFNDNLWSFNFHLFKCLRDESPDGNLFFSPLSVTVALSMTLLGAKEKTEEEMLSVFGLKQGNQSDWHTFLGSVTTSESKSPMTVANKMFVDKDFSILSSFVNDLKKHFNVAHGEVSFATDSSGAVKTINKWVSDATNEKITKLLDELGADTRVVLVNAVHFKGLWTIPFEKERTMDAPFYVNASKQVEVPLMYKSFQVPFYTDKLGSAIRMSFKAPGYSMLLMLPPEGSTLKQMEDSLIANKTELNNVLQKLRKREVDVFVPRFKLRWSKEMKTSLMECGMKDLFSNDKCDLSGVTGNRELFVSAVAHEAVLEVNEEGAEAAAATAVVMMLRCALPPSKPTFRADRPFLVSILKGDSVVFFGRVMNPLA